jgi:hypothetical protein
VPSNFTGARVPGLLLASLVACGGGTADAAAPVAPSHAVANHPDSDRATWKREPSFASCYANVGPGAEVVARVTAMGDACARVTKMHQVGQTVQGLRQALDHPFAIPLHVEANHCYRVYGAADSSLLDLDLALVDSAGKSAGADATDGADAVLLEDGAVCFTSQDDATLNVSSGNGGGKFAVEVWSD